MKRATGRLLGCALKKRRWWKLLIALLVFLAAATHLSTKFYPRRRGTVHAFTVYLLRDGARLRAATKYTESASHKFDTHEQKLKYLEKNAQYYALLIPQSRSGDGIFFVWRRSYRNPIRWLGDSSGQSAFNFSMPWDLAYSSNSDRFDEISDALIWMLEYEPRRGREPLDSAVAWIGTDGGTIEVLRRRQESYTKVLWAALMGEVVSIVLVVWSVCYLLTGRIRKPGSLRRQRRIAAGCCPRCGYDRTGLADTTNCPECGEPVADAGVITGH